MTLTNQKNIAVAHAAFLDYPNWNIVDDAHWVSYIQSIYDLDKCTVSQEHFLRFSLLRMIAEEKQCCV